MIKVPFSIVPPKALKKWSHNLEGLAERLKNFFPSLEINLKHSEVNIDARTYLSTILVSSIINFILFSVIISVLLSVAGVGKSYLYGPAIAIIFTLFAFIQQVMYPRLIVARRVRSIERNLLGALQNVLIQVNSGIPLFDVLVNVSAGNYGEISEEFKKSVKKITAGLNEIEVLEEIASKNPSVYFRRAIWQIVNGMKAGSDISSVLKQTIESLSEEQITKIQRYGSQLNPLAMFYMLIAVILPSLGITFLIIISSFISLSGTLTQIIFWGLYGFVMFFQIMFLGVIKSRRPNLLGE